MAVVTGAARGLGEAVARRLHADGWRVALADLDLAGAERVAGELGDGAYPVLHDIRELDSWSRVLDGVAAELGEPYALVNNAARTEVRGFFEIDVAEWDDVLATNLRGTYLGCRTLGERLRDGGGGRIVNLASVAGQASRAVTGVHYATSKAAIIALTRHAATALAPHGITVNAVAPSTMDTPGNRAAMPDSDRKGWVPVEGVAAAIAWLAAEESAHVTGTVVSV